MTAPRDDIVTKVRQWAAHADDDLRVAQHTLNLPDNCPYRLAAYHAQQCAEKYLKSFLVLRGVDFPYTHNIALLLELCAKHASWSNELTEAEELTPFAIAARYPGDDEPVDEVGSTAGCRDRDGRARTSPQGPERRGRTAYTVVTGEARRYRLMPAVSSLRQGVCVPWA